jgi:sterol desaturase/sphingolipid hydroxylase (fatty acid hydroxylase superfamily)
MSQLITIFAASNAVLLVAELFWPSAGRKFNLGALRFWAISLTAAWAWSFVAVWLTSGIHPLLTWHVTWLLWPLGALAWIVVFDFFYYWFHRASHRFAWLWRFHSVHHSIRDLSALNSYHHPLETVLRFPFITVPLALTVNIDVPQMVAISLLTVAWGQYIHSATRLNFGKWRWLFADNVYHRQHHARDRSGSNFAAYFPLWDWLFRTQRMRDEWPDTGLSDRLPPQTIENYLRPLSR